MTTLSLVIQHGVATGAFDVEDIELPARQARATVDGAFVQWLQDDDWETSHAALREECHEALLRMLRPGT